MSRPPPFEALLPKELLLPALNDPSPSPAAADSDRTTSHCVILVADLVESVVLMQADEEGLVARLRAFFIEVAAVILPEHGGRLIKSTGDGVLADFDDAGSAVAAANAMHRWMARCEPLRDTQKLALRIGVHAAPVFRSSGDLLGLGVALTARIASLAVGGETIATSEVRDLLIDSYDATIDDLGDCHLKHVAEPVRLYRLGPALLPASLPPAETYSTSLRLSLAVVPFTKTLGPAEFQPIGNLLADSLIAQLSLAPELRVVSRLSSQAFAGRRAFRSGLSTIAACLAVRYVVSGSFLVDGSRIAVQVEVADAVESELTWTTRVQGQWRDLLAIDSTIVQQICDEILTRLLDTVATKATSHPLPALKSYELFLGGVALMHRANARDFTRSRTLLEELSERHRRIALPRAWLAKWYVLGATQGALDDPAPASRIALEHTQRALDLEPGSAFALAMEGFVHCHLRKDLETGRQRLIAACEANASESLAWLFYAVLEAFAGHGKIALDAARRALALSPMDPLRYYYESLMGSCSLAADAPLDAILWCESSRRRNRYHLSTLRVLITAYLEVGREVAAREVAADLMRARPGYTVAAYEAHSVAALYPFGQRIARALRAAGIT